MLGVMYANGEGVSEDAAEAVKWFRKAAEQGDAAAQHLLGVAYDDDDGDGDDVPTNHIEAYVWYSIAVANGGEKSKEALRSSIAKLTPEQLIAAQKRAAELTEQINANKAK